MIPNQWYAILESSQVKHGHPVGVTRMGEKLVLWRDAQGHLSCLSDLCPHRGVALSAGRLIGECIECPFHGFQYDTAGRCRLIPANGRNASVPKAFQVKAYPVQEAHGLIYLWWGEPRQNYPSLPWFESIGEDFYSSTVRDHWHTHYSRAIENQLDVAHLPFVHHNTIGRGNRTLVNGPVVQIETPQGESPLLNLWVYNQVDQGQTPLKPTEIPSPDRRPFLQFRFPNLWQNWISDKFRVFVAFAPIDDENTLMYVRMYQKMVTAPILRNFVNLFGAVANLVIVRQDRRVVLTQRPKRTELRMGEKLTQSDGPIIEYRRIRQALLDEVSASQR